MRYIKADSKKKKKKKEGKEYMPRCGCVYLTLQSMHRISYSIHMILKKLENGQGN
jgi:hypothetical protein